MYMQILKNNFKSSYVYRTNTVIKFITSFIYLYVTVNIWQALYSGKTTVDGVSVTQMLTYVLMSQILLCFRNLNISGYLGDKIVSGNIVADFVRPVSVKYMAFFSVLGEVLFEQVIFTIPMICVGGLVWGIQLPASWWQWLGFLVSAMMAALIYASIEYLMGLSVFWLKTAFHVQYIIDALFTLLSGSVVPLWFYPGWMRSIAEVLPFRYIVFEPVRLFVENVTFSTMLFTIGMQMFWILLLNLIGYLVWIKAQTVVTVQGG